ncbi:MAG: type II toxin-antitoxin system HicB family antitoxin [Planctomycetota bacterium]|nr:type II toxin-antitoxin system HicB family antitoxin [Planctomycetota bacterium]
MITKYIEQALKRARYEQLEDKSFAATVNGLRGVIGVTRTLEDCRRKLAEVVEEWILVRVAHDQPIPKLGHVTIRVKRAG